MSAQEDIDEELSAVSARSADKDEDDEAVEDVDVPTREVGAAPEIEDAANAEDASLDGTTTVLDANEDDPTAVKPEAIEAPAAQDVRLGDVTATAGTFLKGLSARIVDFVRTNRAGMAIVVVLAAAAVVGAVIILSHHASLPTDETVAADAVALVATPDYDKGYYGAENILVARTATVRSIEGDETSSDAATASVRVTFSGATVEVEKATTLAYVRTDGAWQATEDPSGATFSWKTLAGVDQERVLENIAQIFTRAERALADDEGTKTLAGIYTGGTIEVASEEFDADAQTDTLVISCSATTGFASYSCEFTVTFAFSAGSGQWTISEVLVSSSAKEASFESIVGTWSGSFLSQETTGTKCLAAKESGFVLSISEATETGEGVRIVGTVSGIAHYHEHPTADTQSCDGDTAFEDVAFVATLTSSDDAPDTLALTMTLPEDVDGKVGVTLCFGIDGDAPITATVTTTYPFTNWILFFPYDDTAIYADTFVLARVS